MKTPDADQLWDYAEQLVKEEDYIDFILITDSFLRSAIHQNIHRLTQQRTIAPPPVLREKNPQFQYLRTMTNGRQYPLLWKTIRVHTIPGDTIIQFPNEYTVQAYYNKQSISIDAWKMDPSDGNVLFLLSNQTRDYITMCILTTNKLEPDLPIYK